MLQEEIILNKKNEPNNAKFSCSFHHVWSVPQNRRFIILLIWFGIACYATGVGNAIAENRAYDHPSLLTEAHLPDLGFDLMYIIFGRGQDSAHIYKGSHDVILLSFIFSTLLLVLIFMKNYRMIIMKRWLLMFNIIFMIRCLTCISTTFPHGQYSTVATNKCIYYHNVFGAPWNMLIYNNMSCYDYFFSGHISNAVMCVVLITKYAYIYLILQRKYPLYIYYTVVSIAWFILLILTMSLLILQVHYSIDIEAAFVITFLLWYIIDNQIETQRGFFSKWETPEEYTEYERIQDKSVDHDVEHGK